ncbi:kinesin-like protein [Coemansia sp. S100]|nr:kinesin-like protein [Coemansia sp. S100]
MSTKMNFGPEWMRSAPASNRLSVSAGEGGVPGAGSVDRLADPDGKYTAVDSANSVGGGSRRYTHERMLELFKAQDFADSFAGSEHVFSEQPLAPVSLTELTSKEYELLSGSINSSASKRYSSTQTLPTVRSQQQHHQQQPSHAYARNGSAHRTSNHSLSNNAWAKLRDPLSRGNGAGVTGGSTDYDPLADLTSNSSNALSGLDQLAGDESNSAWLRQPIARDNVGSFGNDGVFRMGDDDGSGGGDLLEAPASRESMLIGARAATSNYSAPGGSTAGASSRHGVRSMQGRQPPGSVGYADDDGGAWRDLSSAPPTPAAPPGQQHRLLELAEQIKWWYRDPQGSVQGPFSASHMQEWLAGGYFPSDLQVCYEGGSSFEPLGTLITRLGGPQNVFICAALAFLTQGHPSLSGISTPATPNAISRTASVVQLRSPGGDIARSATGTPAARGSMYQLAPGSAAGPAAAASCTTAQSSAYAQPATTSASQISTLLSDQLLIVSAIGERQYMITQYQEQHQQRLAKLMQDLSQEVNAVHYRAQMDRAPVQNEYLVTLQLRAQAAEERLRHDHLQLIQNQASEIGRLEASIDPVIKEMVVRNGTEFAISFINQQLQDLSLMAASESAAPQASVAVASTEQTAAEPTNADSDLLVSNENVVTRKEPAALEPETGAVEHEEAAVVTEADVPALTAGLERVEIATSDEPAATSAVPAKKGASKSAAEKSTSATQPASVAGAKGGKSRSHSKVSETSAAKAASPWGMSKSASKTDAASSSGSATVASSSTIASAPAATSESSALNISVNANVATPAPWSNSTAAAKGKQPKKSLLQIQQEEEEALRKRQQADEQQRVMTAVTRGFGPTYADRLGGSASVAPRSLAAIMAEQSKESSRNSSAVSIADAHPADDSSNSTSGWTVARVISSQTAPTPPAAPTSGPAWGGASAPGAVSNGDTSNFLGAKPVAGRPTVVKPAAAISSNAGPALPSIAFLEWCHSRLSSLRGIDVYKFIEMLLTFPLKAPESTLEIITEQVYAYSTTLNGRAFAEDFVARRAKDHNAVRNGSAKSAPANWAFVLETTKPAASGSANSSGNGFSASATSAPASSRARGASSAGSSFQVVGKKGKK